MIAVGDFPPTTNSGVSTVQKARKTMLKCINIYSIYNSVVFFCLTSFYRLFIKTSVPFCGVADLRELAMVVVDLRPLSEDRLKVSMARLDQFDTLIFSMLK